MADQIAIPSDPTALKAIKGAIQEMVESMVRISAERELMKDIVADVAEKYDMPKKFLNKMARVSFKNSFDKEVSEMSDFEELFTKVTSAK